MIQGINSKQKMAGKCQYPKTLLTLNMNGKVLIIGAGAAGMEAAGQLARAGCMVTLVEKSSETGGHVKNWFHLFPDRRNSSEVIEYLRNR